MGDVLESCGPHGSVATVHGNCLLSLAHVDGRTAVREFYVDAVTSPRQDILNPVNYPDDLMEHIPDESRVRSYGCGSPVLEAELAEGERMLDLGSGSGVECLIAARLVGPGGHVIGVDMLDGMISLACEGAEGAAERLGYGNVEFRKGYLEDLPIEDNSLDVVLSNCVLNLSTHKRRAFAEIRRVLRPGGRLVVSDVVCETEPDPAIRNDELLRGQCIAGALTQRDLFGLLDESGFVGTRVLGYFPYRTVGGHSFYSMTFVARTAAAGETVRVMYRGPFASAVTSEGTLLSAGQTRGVLANEIHGAGDEVFEFDDQGHVTNADIEPCACCALPPEKQNGPSATVASQEKSIEPPTQKQRSGCMVCGSPLVYDNRPSEAACSYCGVKQQTTALCENGHFVCDACHTKDALVVIERVCQQTDETDMISLLDRIRRHEAMRVHGPEHHAMVPAIILATARNLGAPVTEEMIRLGIQRGSRVVGGHCAYVGACGAALGVGVAFSLILECNPVKGSQRKTVQSAVMAALEPIAALDAARCCQRDSWLALKKAAESSHEILPVALHADAPLRCAQVSANAQCMGDTCPLFPSDKAEHSQVG
jgi:SAM-dependent methyltransferase